MENGPFAETTEMKAEWREFEQLFAAILTLFVLFKTRKECIFTWSKIQKSLAKMLGR
jgi:hypothetical protein